MPVAVIVKLLAAGTDAPYARMYQVPGAAAGTSNCGLAEPPDELALKSTGVGGEPSLA